MKKVTSFLLALAIVVGMFPTTIGAAGDPEIKMVADKNTVSAGETVTLTISLDTAIENLNDFQYNLEFDADLFTKTSHVIGNAYAATQVGAQGTTVGGNAYLPVSGLDSNGDPFTLNAGTIVTVTFTANVGIAVDVTANFKLSFVSTTNYDDFTNYTVTMPADVSVAVKVPSASGSPYEINYTLSGSSFTGTGDTDEYTDYNIGDTVTAEVFLKNNSGADTYLQAYDIYLSHSGNLTYTGTTIKGTAHMAGGKLAHIQAVGKDDSGAVVLGNVDFDNNAEISLGTISFTINTAAVYDIALPITLSVGEGDDKTNISVGAEATGDKNSYYPAFGGDVLGAEVMTTYTVTYDANGGAFEAGAVTTQVKQYNVPLTIAAPATPSRTGYTFQGWSTDSGESNTVNAPATYTTNENETLYAVWQKNTVNITFNNNGGSGTMDAQTVGYGEAANLNANAFSKTGYTFNGWNTAANGTGTSYADKAQVAFTADTTLYAQWTINKYTVTWYNGSTLLETDAEVEYNANPEYDGNEPTMSDSANGQYSYKFLGWSTTQNPGFGAETVDLNNYHVTGATVFYAVFQQNVKEYTVTFATEDKGNLTGADAQTIAYGNKLSSVPTATANAGYTFAGWYVGDTKVTPTDYIVTGDVTLTAKYTANTYTVTFMANGGTGTMIPQNFTYGVSQALNANTFTAPTGKSFVGWNTAANGSGTSYGAGERISISSNITLYAQWDNVAYTVTVNPSNNGTVSANPSGGNYEQEITLTITPAAGYELDTLTVKDDASQNDVTVSNNKFNMPASHVTVSATFKAINYTVGIDATENGDVSADLTTATIGQTVTLSNTPANGYKLVSYIVTDGSGASVSVTDNKFAMPASNVTVTAEFAPITYTIRFDGNGATSGNIDPIAGVKYGEVKTLPENVYARNGYKFLGWSEDKNATNATYADQASVTNLTSTDEATVTLYAIWDEDTFEITLNTNEGTINSGNVTEYTYGTGATLPTNITKTGHDFGGWYTNANFTGDAVTEIGTNEFGAKEFYAKWTPSVYNITLNTNGGTINDGDVTEYTYGTIVALPTDITKTGYDFGGWYTNADFTGDAVTGITTTDTGDKTYYAKWNAIEYTITFMDGETELTALKVIYTIETPTVNLPVPTKDYYTFKTWNLASAAGNWAAGDYSVTDLNDAVINYAGKYGNITLTAQWDITLVHEVESYTYAKTGYVMLRIATDANTNAYSFAGETMFYTNDINYQINGKGVFVTLIPKYDTDGTTALVDMDEGVLTEKGMEKLARSGQAAVAVAYDGDVNGDGVINVADANVVYQMLNNGGSYYADLSNGDQTDILSRLEADKSTATTAGDMRGTLTDVNAIVAIINA